MDELEIDVIEVSDGDNEASHKLEGALGDYIGNATDLNSVLNNKKGDNYKYYYGDQFGNEQEGQSDHVTMDVFDAVESAKSRLLSTFASSRNIVHYKPQTSADIEAAALRNALVKDIFWNDNQGYKILHDAFHDGLLNRWFGIKWYWQKNPTKLQDQAVIPAQEQDIYATISQIEQMGAQVINVSKNPDQTITINYGTIKDYGKVKIEVIAPERILIESGAEDQETSSFIAEEMRVTGSELVQMGVDAGALKYIDNYRPSADATGAERRRNDETTIFDNDSPTPEGQVYKVYNAFIQIDLDGSGISQLYNCICDYNGKLLIDPVPVDRPQLIVGSLLPQAHKISGMALAEVIKPIQKSSSMVMRQYIDHLSRVNTGRMAADMQLVRNPKQLLENHIGGVVDVEFMDGKPALFDIPQPQLSPATGVVLEELKQEKEQRGGVSRLAQGLNNDAVSNQNADSLIERLTNLSTARVMMMARHFAEMILKPLFDGVFSLATQMDEKPRLLEIGGQKEEVAPAEMRGDFELSTEMTVTEEEAVKRAQSLMLMHNTLLQDPDAPMLYPTPKRYAIYSEVFKAMGESPHMFMQDPNAQEQQASFAQMQMQMQEMQMQLQQAGGAIDQLSMQNQELQAALANKQFDQRIKAHEEHRKDAEFAHEVLQDNREYQLEKTQDRGVSL